VQRWPDDVLLRPVVQLPKRDPERVDQLLASETFGWFRDIHDPLCSETCHPEIVGCA
jgi:hypothetical protein